MAALAAASALVLTACGSAGDAGRSAPSTSTAAGVATSSPTTAPATPRSTPDPPAPTAPGRERWIRGIDASHHQGDIGWDEVAGDDIDFAYLKASEGSTFTDPRFVENVAGARAAGRTTLPPAVDLELQGQCSTPPTRADLLAEVRAFLEVVEEATGRRVVVYEFPDFEEEYRVADELGRRQWVRRVGDVPPARDWWIWQRSDDASVAGIDGPADLNLMRS